MRQILKAGKDRADEEKPPVDSRHGRHLRETPGLDATSEKVVKALFSAMKLRGAENRNGKRT